MIIALVSGVAIALAAVVWVLRPLFGDLPGRCKRCGHVVAEAGASHCGDCGAGVAEA